MILDLPVELIREIILEVDELSDFGSLILTCTTFYQAVQKDITKQKIKLQSKITINNLLRSHKGRVGITSSILELKESSEFYMGILRDMINKKEPTFPLSSGNWEIFSYFDHAYYAYGYNTQYVNVKSEEMMLIHESTGYDDLFGIAQKRIFDERYRVAFGEDKFANDALEEKGEKEEREEEWKEWLHEHWNDWSDHFITSETDLEVDISGGRGEDIFSVYAAEYDGEIIAWWIFPKSDDIIDILNIINKKYSDIILANKYNI